MLLITDSIIKCEHINIIFWSEWIKTWSATSVHVVILNTVHAVIIKPFFLFEKQEVYIKKERETTTFHLLAYSPSWLQQLELSRWQSGARSSIRISHMLAELISWGSDWHPSGMLALQAAASSTVPWQWSYAHIIVFTNMKMQCGRANGWFHYVQKYFNWKCLNQIKWGNIITES